MGGTMILLALAAAALAQWTGPRTVEYIGPGYFCGGGYARSRSAKGERALILPQGPGADRRRAWSCRRGEVNILTGARPGRRHGGHARTERHGGDPAERRRRRRLYRRRPDAASHLRVTSAAFRGFKSDRWFFTKADFTDGADQTVACSLPTAY